MVLYPDIVDGYLLFSQDGYVKSEYLKLFASYLASSLVLEIWSIVGLWRSASKNIFLPAFMIHTSLRKSPWLRELVGRINALEQKFVVEDIDSIEACRAGRGSAFSFDGLAPGA